LHVIILWSFLLQYPPMFVIHVIPLMRATTVESLTYFSPKDYPIGSIVTAPVRGKQYRAIVTEVAPVSSAKTTLKLAHFSLRKLPDQGEKVVVLPETLRQTARALAARYPATEGALLYHLLPPEVRSGERPYPEAGTHHHDEDTTPAILTARGDERIVAYRSHVRSMFAHRGSILLVAPTALDAERLAKAITHGIEERVVLLTPLGGKRALDRAYKAINDTSLMRLIITTPSHAYLERTDLLSIIIDGAASPHYKTRTRPYLDHRDALMAYAIAGGRSIILGDNAPRTEDEVRRRDERYSTWGEGGKRIVFPANLTVIKHRDKPTPDIPFTLFSSTLTHHLTTSLEAREHIFLCGARRGLSPVVACQDCGYIFRCPDSGTPYSLLRTYRDGKEERWFVSSTSGTRVAAADVCAACGSWRLRERGIGIQHVYDEAKTRFPTAPIFLFDNTTATTAKGAQKIIDRFYETRGGILVGTAMALPYLRVRGVETSVVVSFDATRSIPSWRADEWVFQFLLQIRELTRREVYVQTRTDDDQLLTFAARGALERFYDEEIRLRHELVYPPFSTLILCSWQGPTATIKTVDDLIKNATAPHVPQCYNDPHSTPERATRHALLRLPPEAAREAALMSRLRTLPPYIKIEIDPDRIV
jgi:primosomal protein N'